MKNELKSLFVIAGLLLGMTVMASAGGLTKPRKSALVNYTTTATLVHRGGGALYQVVLSTGASLEYMVAIDTVGASGWSATTTNLLITPRLFYSSTSANSVYTFDPPLIYTNGLVIAGSAGTGQAMVTYESGRSIGGQ